MPSTQPEETEVGVRQRVWLPIAVAPKDGRPVWARGHNFGDPSRGLHQTWVWWDGSAWRDTNVQEPSHMIHLFEWLPTGIC